MSLSTETPTKQAPSSLLALTEPILEPMAVAPGAVCSTWSPNAHGLGM